MFDPEIARVEPAASKGLGGSLRVFEVTLHHDIAAEHDFAHRLAIGGYGLHGFGIDDIKGFEGEITDALTRLLGGLTSKIDRVPLDFPVIDDGGAIGLGEAIEMSDVEASLFHTGENGLGWRGGGGEEFDDMRQRKFFIVRCVQERRHDNGGTAQMGDLMLGNGSIHGFGAHLPQADMRAGAN